MSREDRSRWDQRFADGAYAERLHPSAIVAQWASHGPGRALDVAAGAGRNAAWLASQGFAVTALDISPVGLRRAQERTPEIVTIAHDLDEGLPPGLGAFDLIVMTRYLNLSLIPALVAMLAPGGRLIVEVLLQATGGVGPAGGRFRAPPGALAQACQGLRELHSFEGEINDPDGRAAQVAQFVGVL